MIYHLRGKKVNNVQITVQTILMKSHYVFLVCICQPDLLFFLICTGEMVTKQPLIRSMRTVKRETLKLISGWVSRSNDPQMVSLTLFTFL